jgi:hypothetical protein
MLKIYLLIAMKKYLETLWIGAEQIKEYAISKKNKCLYSWIWTRTMSTR